MMSVADERPTTASPLRLRGAPSFHRLDGVVTVVAVLLFADAFVSWLVQVRGDGAATMDEGNPLYQVLIAACYAYAAARLGGTWRELRRVLPALVPALILVALAVMSAAWADLPALALRRAVALAGTTLFALFVALRIGAARALWLVGLALAAAAVASIVVSLLLPDLARETRLGHEGLWRGVFQQKNLLGRAMLVGVLAAVAVHESFPTRRLVAWGIGAVCLICIVGSGSATAALLALAIPAAGLLVRTLRFRPALLLAVGAVLAGAAVAAAVWIAKDPTRIFLALGKDPTLSGRTVIWAIALDNGMQHAWLGAGYKTFWNAEEGVGGAISELLGWSIDTGHNSFLDLWLDVGVVGLAVGVTSLVVLGRDALRVLRRASAPPARWAATFLAIMVLLSFSHTVVAVQNSLFWFLQVAFTVWTRRVALRLAADGEPSRAIPARRCTAAQLTPLPSPTR